MIRRPIALILCLTLLAGALPLFSHAEDDDFSVTLFNCDTYVYSGGYYDMYASSTVEGCKYQWIARYGLDGSFVALHDNERYSGTDTYHFRFLTADGFAYGTDWQNIQFGCMVTAPDGRIRLTRALTMDIATREKLQKDIEAKKLAIEDFRIGGYMPAPEENGVVCYNVDADKKLAFYADIPDPGTQFVQSEVTFKADVFVTQDGKTTRLQQRGERVPLYTVGDRAVTARAELNVYQNGEKLMTLDTKQMVVNSAVPSYQAEGVAKYDCQLLFEQYNESRKLTSVAKNSRVNVVETDGSWCRVVCNGYIGYLPTDALTLYDAIGQVGIRIQEPNRDVPVDLNVAFESGDYGLYDTDPVNWYDNTADRFLGKGDKFIKNHEYSLSVWLKAENGRHFAVTSSNHCSVTGTVNGAEATVRTAYEQDPREVVEISIKYTHLHDPQKVTQVNPTCTEDGKLTHYLCACGADFVDNRSLERITDPNWGILPARGHRESDWITDAQGHHKVCLRRECGEVIYYTAGDHTGGTANCSERAICEVCGASYGEYGGHVYTQEWNYRSDAGHARKCTVLICGKRSEVVPHVPGPEATATQPQVCLDCGWVLKYSKEQNPYADIPANKWYTDAALWCSANGYMTGTSPTTFSPSTALNRAMFVQILARVELGSSLDSIAYNGAFIDVFAGDWFARAVQWASDNGVTGGTGGGKFSPRANVTRQQIATFFMAYARFKGYDVSASASLDAYTDAPQIGGWALGAVKWAVAEELISGTSETTLSPRAEATRAQAAVIFKKFVEVYAAKQGN